MKIKCWQFQVKITYNNDAAPLYDILPFPTSTPFGLIHR